LGVDSDRYDTDPGTDRGTAQLIPNASVDDSMDIGARNHRSSEMQNIKMESDAGEQDDTQRVGLRPRTANEGAASFGVNARSIHGQEGIGFGSEKQQDETQLGKWAHKERTLNGTVSFKAHLEDEPNLFTSRGNLFENEIQHDGGAIHAMPSGIQQEKNVTAVSGRSGLTDIAKMNANIDQGAQKIAET